MGLYPQPAVYRILGRCQVDDPNNCWVWTGPCGRGGYGQVRSYGRTRSNHRIIYEHFYGPIPKGVCVLHRCDNPPCVNPEHLFLGTNLDNSRDRDSKGRNGFANKTHCPQGHPYNEENTRIGKLGSRACRTCDRDRSRQTRRREKERMSTLAEDLAVTVDSTIGEWLREGQEARATYVPRITEEDLQAYDLSDPKRISLEREMEKR